MTTQLEAAARQALEALEKCDSALAEELAAWDIDPPLQHVLDASNACDPAITALRSALEQQAAQEPVSTRTIGDTRRARDAGYAAGVASSLPNKITAEMRSAFREGYKGGSIWTDRLDRALECMLAAAPQQAAQVRQPLTEEEIDALIQQHVDPVATYRKLHQFARAVEDAAHGIGDDK